MCNIKSIIDVARKFVFSDAFRKIIDATASAAIGVLVAISFASNIASADYSKYAIGVVLLWLTFTFWANAQNRIKPANGFGARLRAHLGPLVTAYLSVLGNVCIAFGCSAIPISLSGNSQNVFLRWGLGLAIAGLCLQFFPGPYEVLSVKK